VSIWSVYRIIQILPLEVVEGESDAAAVAYTDPALAIPIAVLILPSDLERFDVL
jgi:hypothetical protein